MAKRSTKQPIRLSTRLAGICGSAVFFLVTVTAYLSNMDLLQVFFSLLTQGETRGVDLSDTMNAFYTVLTWGLFGAFLGGGIGYVLGEVLDNPRGTAAPRKEISQIALPQQEELSGASVGQITGDETFLDDVVLDEAASLAEMNPTPVAAPEERP